MPKIDYEALPLKSDTGYPLPFDEPVAGRWYRRLAPAGGLSHMGATFVTLKPGAWSSQRHWHETEDELVVMIAGEAVLIEDEGETILKPGDSAAFPGGVRNGHHLVNRSAADCSFIAIGAGPDTGGGYADIDMLFTEDGRYTRKDGTDYAAKRG